MSIKVNTHELMINSNYVRNLCNKLENEVAELRYIRYSLDYKVKSRNGIENKILNLEKRIERL